MVTHATQNFDANILSLQQYITLKPSGTSVLRLSKHVFFIPLIQSIKHIHHPQHHTKGLRRILKEMFSICFSANPPSSKVVLEHNFILEEGKTSELMVSPNLQKPFSFWYKTNKVMSFTYSFIRKCARTRQKQMMPSYRERYIRMKKGMKS